MLTSSIAVNCLVIFLARVVDVSLGTIRTLAVVRGARLAAWALGFLEILIWIWVVSEVIQSVKDTPIYSLFYAIGFASGNYVGMTIEHWLAFGDKIVILFTRNGERVAEHLRSHEYIVTEWTGKGQQGPIELLLLKLPRKMVKDVLTQAKQLDPACFFVVDSVDSAIAVRPTLLPRTGWRSQARKGK